MKKWEMATDNLYYKDLVCLVLSEENQLDKYVLGYASKFYDENDIEYMGIEFITELTEEINNINIKKMFGTIEENYPETIKIINNGKWYIYTNHETI